MMLNKLIISVVMLVLFFSFNSYAASLKDEGRPTDIKVEEGKVTQVEFPAKVAKIVKGGDPDSVLVEVLDNSVYLLPKNQTPSDIFVTTVSGSSYPLNLRIGSNHDIKIQAGSIKNQSSGPVGGYYSDVMDLMKDLLLNREPAGASLLPAQGSVLLSNDQIKLTVDKVYELSDWKAYILVARNLAKNSVIIPIEQIALPDLLAVSSQRDMLTPKGREGDSSKVYVIMRATNENPGI